MGSCATVGWLGEGRARLGGALPAKPAPGRSCVRLCLGANCPQVAGPEMPCEAQPGLMATSSESECAPGQGLWSVLSPPVGAPLRSYYCMSVCPSSVKASLRRSF